MQVPAEEGCSDDRVRSRNTDLPVRRPLVSYVRAACDPARAFLMCYAWLVAVSIPHSIVHEFDSGNEKGHECLAASQDSCPSTLSRDALCELENGARILDSVV